MGSDGQRTSSWMVDFATEGDGDEPSVCDATPPHLSRHPPHTLKLFHIKPQKEHRVENDKDGTLPRGCRFHVISAGSLKCPRKHQACEHIRRAPGPSHPRLRALQLLSHPTLRALLRGKPLLTMTRLRALQLLNGKPFLTIPRPRALQLWSRLRALDPTTSCTNSVCKGTWFGTARVMKR